MFSIQNISFLSFQYVISKLKGVVYIGCLPDVMIILLEYYCFEDDANNVDVTIVSLGSQVCISYSSIFY